MQTNIMLAKHTLYSSFSVEEKTTVKGSPVGGWVWVGECACLCVWVSEKKTSIFSISDFGPDFSRVVSPMFLRLAD